MRRISLVAIAMMFFLSGGSEASAQDYRTQSVQVDRFFLDIPGQQERVISEEEARQLHCVVWNTVFGGNQAHCTPYGMSGVVMQQMMVPAYHQMRPVVRYYLRQRPW